jgi:hypothetical protein
MDKSFKSDINLAALLHQSEGNTTNPAMQFITRPIDEARNINDYEKMQALVEKARENS